MTAPHDPSSGTPWTGGESGQGYGQGPYQGGYGQWGGQGPYQPQGYPPQGGYPPRWYGRDYGGVPMPSPGHTPFGDTNCVGQRVLQYLVDIGLLGWLPIIALVVVVNLLANAGVSDAIVGVVALVWMLALLALQLWNYVFWPAVGSGQTLGMRWLGVRIVSADGGKLTAGKTFVRWVLLFLDGLVMYGLVGLIVTLVSDLHQRLGDMVAKTLVVRVR